MVLPEVCRINSGEGMLHQQKVQVGTVFCWRNVLLTVVTLNHFFIVPRRKIGAIYRFLNYLKTLPFPPCCYSWQKNTGNLELFFMLVNTVYEHCTDIS